MQVNYDCTGEARKALVKAIGDIVGVKPKYQGMPSAAYTVGGFQIDKVGTVTAAENTSREDFDCLMEQLSMKGFEAVVDMSASASVDAAPESSLIAEPEPVTEVESPTIAPVALESEPYPTIIELPRGDLTESQLSNLSKLIASKATLIMKALGSAELGVKAYDDRLVFPWFNRALEAYELAAYTRFIVALYEMAKRQKRVRGDEREVDSEKFAFRIFLLRLGYGGPAHAADRKLLLQNLSGSAAFPNDAKRDEHTERWKA